MSHRLLSTAIGIVLVVSACFVGCVRQRTVLVPAGECVQLAEPVEAYIYVAVAGHRERSAHRVILPEGWWVLPDPED